MQQIHVLGVSAAAVLNMTGILSQLPQPIWQFRGVQTLHHQHVRKGARLRDIQVSGSFSLPLGKVHICDYPAAIVIKKCASSMIALEGEGPRLLF